MAKTSRKNISRKNISRKNKKSKKNVKNYSRKNKINKMRGGEGLDGLKLKNIRENKTTYTVLDFTDTEINDDQVKLLADALRTNTVVTSITFNKIGYEGAKALIIVLFGNTTLTEFKINNPENIKRIDEDIMTDFEFIIKRNIYRITYKEKNPNATLADFTEQFYTYLQTVDSIFYNKNKELIDNLKKGNFGLM
jgi:hypothetical protein